MQQNFSPSQPPNSIAFQFRFLRHLLSALGILLLINLLCAILLPMPLALVTGPMAVLTAVVGALIACFSLAKRFYFFAFIMAGLTITLFLYGLSVSMLLFNTDAASAFSTCLNEAITNQARDACYLEFSESAKSWVFNQ